MRCDWCDGEGEWSQSYPLTGYGSEYLDCPKCKGTGRMLFSGRFVVLFFAVLLLVAMIVFTLSLMFTDDGLAFAWKPWPIW